MCLNDVRSVGRLAKREHAVQRVVFCENNDIKHRLYVGCEYTPLRVV